MGQIDGCNGVIFSISQEKFVTIPCIHKIEIFVILPTRRGGFGEIPTKPLPPPVKCTNLSFFIYLIIF
jgi:hypothetical protein